MAFCRLTGAARRYHSFACSMDNLLNICGKIPAAPRTVPKVKVVNKAMPSCLCFSPWVSTLHLRKPALSCGQGSVSMPERWGRVRHRGRTVARSSQNQDPLWQVWNRAGERPQICDVLERIARLQNPRAVVWRGSGIPSDQQGMKVLGTPLGHVDFVTQHLQSVTDEQRCLLERIPLIRLVVAPPLRIRSSKLPDSGSVPCSGGVVRTDP